MLPLPGLITAVRASLRSALSSSLLILKLIVPLYVLADVLLYFDLLRHLTFLFEPVTRLLHLPTEAAIALAGGVLINIYAAIAFAAPLGLEPVQWTVLAVFLGVCHAMVIECAIMARLGLAYGYSIILRLGMAFLTVWPLRWMPASWFQGDTGPAVPRGTQQHNFPDMLLDSLLGALGLSAKVILLIALIIVAMDLIKAAPLVQRYTRKVNTAFSIIAGQLLGITYGAGILMREVTRGSLSRKDLLFVGTFLSICHSIIEDVLLFVIFGANFWVVVGLRLFFATGASILLTLLFRRCLPMDWVVRA